MHPPNTREERKLNLQSLVPPLAAHVYRLDSVGPLCPRCSTGLGPAQTEGDQHARDTGGSSDVERRPLRLGRLSADELVRHVDQRLKYELPLDAVSKHVGLSRAAFTRIFRAYFRISFHRYVVQRRIAIARELLIRTDFDLAVIGEETGFCSQSHFATVFRAIAGISPGRFREQRRLDTGSLVAGAELDGCRS